MPDWNTYMALYRSRWKGRKDVTPDPRDDYDYSICGREDCSVHRAIECIHASTEPGTKMCKDKIERDRVEFCAALLQFGITLIVLLLLLLVGGAFTSTPARRPVQVEAATP